MSGEVKAPVAPDPRDLATLLTGDLAAELPDTVLRRLEPSAIFVCELSWLQAERETA